jgi:lysyl-tRNA synthetase class 2
VRRCRDDTVDPVDIPGEWTAKTVHDAVSEALGEHIDAQTDLTSLRKLSDRAGIPYLTHWDAGAVVLEMCAHLVEDRTEQPTLYKDFPTSVSPLTRPHRSIPGVAERWDLVACGARCTAG